MSDTAVNKVIQYGTQAQRLAFTPNPAVGSQILYLWYETDNPPDLYAWNGSAWVQVNATGTGITELTGAVTAGPGSGSQAASIAAGAVTTAKIGNSNVTYAKIQNVSASDRLLGRDSAGAGVIEEIPVTSGLEFTAGPGLRLSTQARTRQITVIIDGGGSAIATGLKVFLSCPYTGTITGWRLLSIDAAGPATVGDLVVDIWKDTYANYPPTVADTITAAAKPTLSSANKAEDGTLTGWTTGVTAGDVFGFNVDSAATVTKVALTLTIVLN